jgi:hypothetical protein
MNFYVEGWNHHKNKIGLDLMIGEGMEVDFVRILGKQYDWIVSLSEFKTFENHNGGIIYGPHMTFPAVNPNQIPNKEGRVYCNTLSEWNTKLCEDIIPGVKFLSLPFGVDVKRFTPSEKTGKPVLYYKTVDPNRVRDVLNNVKEDFIIFNYNQKYDESEFKDAISKAPYAIWLGRHESQGFAFQETLSCNTPIFVIDVRSLREEIGSTWVNYMPGHPLKCTAASSFDDSCGVLTYPESWKEDWGKFIAGQYSPREFVVNKLSPKACLNLWIETLKNL